MNKKTSENKKEKTRKSRTGTRRTGKDKSGSGKTGSGGRGRSKSGSGRTGSSKTGSLKTGSGRTGRSKSGSGKTGSGRTGRSRSGSSKSGNTRTGNSRNRRSGTGKKKSSGRKAGKGKFTAFLDPWIKQANRLAMILTLVLVVTGLFFIISSLDRKVRPEKPSIREEYLTPSEYNRSKIPLGRVRGIVIHYVANPGSSARENRDYFEGLATSHVAKASSHFIIGLSGEIIQCIPLDEMAYASNERNSDTISIECCHPDSDGKFNDKTRESLVQLTAWLCDQYSLTSRQVIRHYDITGKLCPLYYVEHEDAWESLKRDVDERLGSGLLR